MIGVLEQLLFNDFSTESYYPLYATAFGKDDLRPSGVVRTKMHGWMRMIAQLQYPIIEDICAIGLCDTRKTSINATRMK